MILSQERADEIDSIIQNIFMSLGASYPKNTLVEIAEAAGARVIIDDMSSIAKDISGAIFYSSDDGKKDPIILINSKNHINRQRFTLAHELGHLFLHNGTKLRIDTLNYSADDSITILEETEANYFAASLLIPEDDLIAEIDEGLSISELASFFGVSEAAIENRIKWVKKKHRRAKK